MAYLCKSVFTRINRIRYIEYGTERSPAKLTRPTFNELYEPKKLMFNILGELTGTIDTEKLVHNHSLIACVLWKDLYGIENKSIASSIKKFSTMSREDMEELSKTVELRYLLGVMNSKYASVLLTNLRGGDYHIYPEHIRNIPIPSATPAQQKPSLALVDTRLKQVRTSVLAAKKANPQADTSKEKAEIDRTSTHTCYACMFALYGLSEDEIKIVEGG